MYELEARFGWSGQAVGEDEAKTLGEIIVTGIDSTNEPDEYEFKVHITTIFACRAQADAIMIMRLAEDA